MAGRSVVAGVVLRRPLMGEIVVAGEDVGQQLLAFVEVDRKAGQSITGYEYAVLVTNTDYEFSAWASSTGIGRMPNAFDELKNQWGWSGLPRPAPLPVGRPGSGADLQLVEPVHRLANPEARRQGASPAGRG